MITRTEAVSRALRGRNPDETGTWEVRAAPFSADGFGTRYAEPRRMGVVRGTLGAALRWATGESRWPTFSSGVAHGSVEPYTAPFIEEVR